MVLAYLFVLLWLLAAYFRMRQVLRWWYQRQSAQLCCEAERIREGLLQESFSMRRSLELALSNDRVCTQELQNWLVQIEAIQHSLEAVTHRLSPPYLDDSLPLAVQHVLKQLQATHPEIHLEVELPTDWNEEPIEQRRVILSFLNELLQLIAFQPQSETVLQVRLSQQAQSRRLIIQLNTSNVSDLLSSARRELMYLQEFFQVMTAGKCYCQKQSSKVTWCCQWQSQSFNSGRQLERK
ncbi:MAG: hypothetical protein LH702_27445 [Phormidesmis sp. CAN_BIN44]|nr:hypothetical protein [Phormidesmis sp. CAN_BIN44]